MPVSGEMLRISAKAKVLPRLQHTLAVVPGWAMHHLDAHQDGRGIPADPQFSQLTCICFACVVTIWDIPNWNLLSAELVFPCLTRASSRARSVSQDSCHFCCHPRPRRIPRTFAKSQGHWQHLFPQPLIPTTDTSHKPFLSLQTTTNKSKLA